MFNGDDGDGNSEGDVGLRSALNILVAARDGEVTALAADTGDIVLHVQVGW